MADLPAPVTAVPAPERLTADSARTTGEGTTFMAPEGWSILAKGSMVVLEPPEPDTHLALVEVRAANADDAVRTAWAAFEPDARRALKLSTPLSAREGWDERRGYQYETSPNERRVVTARALRHGDLWTVLLVDASEPAYERRLAQIVLLQSSLRPRGYVRESFAGRKAHPLDRDRIKQITDFVEVSQRELGIPGAAVALIDHGEVVFEGGFGVRELGKPARVDEDTQFAIGSNTKGMTTLLLARLVDEGKLAWDMPVTQAYPGFALGNAETTRRVEIEHLVCACTGLPRQDLEWIFQFRKLTPQKGMDLLATMQPTTRFGEVFQYSNALAAAAGWVAAHVVYPGEELGAAYDEAMRKLVFDPLGMKAARFDFARAETGNHAWPHGDDIDGNPAVAKMDLNDSVIPIRPAGGAWVSAHEMTRYALLELSRGVLPNGERLVSEKNLLARRAPQIAIGEDVTYGMGLMVDKTWGVPFVHHGGALFGYMSDWLIFPEQGVGAVILTNSNTGALLLRPFARRVAEVIFDGRAEAAEDVAVAAKDKAAAIAKLRERLVFPPDPAAVAKLAAHYTSRELGELTVRGQGDATVFDFGAFTLTMASRKNDDGTISFIAIDPALDRTDAMGFVVGERSGKRVLILRDAQHEYLFTEAG